jgi:hypothetical protein
MFYSSLPVWATYDEQNTNFGSIPEKHVIEAADKLEQFHAFDQQQLQT